MIEFKYILFHILLLLITYIYGKQISKRPIQLYWKIGIWIIIAFTIEEGFRWGRNIDWCVYYNVYQDYLKGFSSNHEILFQALWRTYAYFNLPYYIVIASCSGLLIYSILYLCKPYKEVAFILIPFIIAMCANNATNLIRWYMAFSFLLIAIRLYLNGKIKHSIVFTICSICTHLGMIIAIPIFYFIINRKRIFFKPLTTILISLALIVLFDPSVLGKFSFIFDLFSGFERFNTYSEDATGWLTGTGQNADSIRRSYMEQLIATIPLWTYIISGDKLCKINKHFIPIYNLTAIGIFLKNAASGLELFSRYAYLFEPFICIIAAYGILFLHKEKKWTVSNILLYTIGIFFIIRKFFMFCTPMEYEQFMHYLWDSNIDPNELIWLYKSRIINI